MFKEMMRSKKSWELFCKWLDEKYGYDYNNDINEFFTDSSCCCSYESIHNIFILSIMPFFFDEHEIRIYPRPDTHFKYDIIWMTKKLFRHFLSSKNRFEKRIDYLIESCEKAFEILEVKINGS